MNKRFITLIFVFLFGITNAQKKPTSVYININRSRHGSGDMNGVSFDVGYKQKIKHKLNWYGELNASSHSISFYESYVDNNSETIDASLRFVTSGMQISGGVSYTALIKSNDLNLQLGVILRHQTSSLPTSVSTYYPIVTKLPFPAHAFKQIDNPMRTFGVGWKLGMGYSYTIKNNFLFGINGNIQNDTNGDTIYGYGLTVGKRF